MTEDQEKGIAQAEQMNQNMRQFGTIDVPMSMMPAIPNMMMLEAAAAAFDAPNMFPASHYPPAQAITIEYAAMFKAYQGNKHFDDHHVEMWAQKLKAKMARSRAKGRDCWFDPVQTDAQGLCDQFIGHVGKGNPGNFEDLGCILMMLSQRGDSEMAMPVALEDWYQKRYQAERSVNYNYRSSNGPDTHDGHNSDGFIGGCDRMGCAADAECRKNPAPSSPVGVPNGATHISEDGHFFIVPPAGEEDGTWGEWDSSESRWVPVTPFNMVKLYRLSQCNGDQA